MARTKLNGVIAGALIAAVALGACGSDNSGNSLSQAEYKQKTNAACANFKPEFDAALKNVDITKPNSVKDGANNAADALHNVAKKLRDIGYPDGKQDLANQLSDAIDKAADLLSSNANVLKQTEAPKEFNEVDRLSQRLGITSCSG